ncbi:hypothetical protein BC829DRAFT_383175 [Chytridium lagenaria]|nr:hypothetical protein BC829DRAFT_383175 [Chytridium lagenaria]
MITTGTTYGTTASPTNSSNNFFAESQQHQQQQQQQQHYQSDRTTSAKTDSQEHHHHHPSIKSHGASSPLLSNKFSDLSLIDRKPLMVHSNNPWAMTGTGQPLSLLPHNDYLQRSDIDNAKYGFPRPEVASNGAHWNGGDMSDYSNDASNYLQEDAIARAFPWKRYQSDSHQTFVDGKASPARQPSPPSPTGRHIPACAINPYTGRQFLLSNGGEAKYLQNSSFIEPPSPTINHMNNHHMNHMNTQNYRSNIVRKTDIRAGDIRSSAPPDGYICRKCNVPGHWIQQCGNMKQSTPMPPDTYLCKICTVPGHWIWSCPRRRYLPAQVM